jgi:hypothetical protein
MTIPTLTTSLWFAVASMAAASVLRAPAWLVALTGLAVGAWMGRELTIAKEG